MKIKSSILVSAAILLASCGGTMQSDALKYLEDQAQTMQDGFKGSSYVSKVKTVPPSFDESQITMRADLPEKMAQSYMEAEKKNLAEKKEAHKLKSQEYETKRVEFISGLDTCIAQVSRMKADGDDALKNAALDLLKTYKSKVENEYKELVQMYISGEQDQSKYDALSEKIKSDMEEKNKAYKKEQEEFGKKYRIDIERDKIKASIYGGRSW